MSAEVQSLIERGQQAIREGRKDEAQEYLITVTEIDEQNEEAWLWLAAAVSTEEEQKICLDNVLLINPENTQARQMIAELERNQGTVSNFDNLLDEPDPLGTGEYTAVEPEAEPTADASGGPFDANSFGTFSEEEREDSLSFEDDFRGIYEEEDKYGSLMAQPDDEDIDSPVDEVESYTEPETSPSYAEPEPADEVYTSSYDESLSDDGFGFDERDTEDEEIDYLTMLSPDTKPTRVPGTDVKSERGATMGVIVLGLLNVVAIGLLVFQLLA